MINDLPPREEVVWWFKESNGYSEKLISVLGCCGLSHLTFEFNGTRVPIFLDFYEKDGELWVNVEIGRVLKFSAIVQRHDGTKGLEALYKELGREAVEKHLERAKMWLRKYLEWRGVLDGSNL